MLLLAFMDCGLIEGLIHISSDLPKDANNNTSNDSLNDAKLKKNRIVTQKATVLLGELLHLSNILLPGSQCAKLQVLHHLLMFLFPQLILLI